jgi:hypothetical protein
MNPIARLAAAGALILLSACGKKAETPPPAPVQTTAPEPAPKAREAEAKPQAVAPVPNEAPASPAAAKPAAPATPPAPPPAAAPAPKKAPMSQSEVEQDLKPAIDHARATTKSEKSAARSRAEKAEAEMMELTGKK